MINRSMSVCGCKSVTYQVTCENVHSDHIASKLKSLISVSLISEKKEEAHAGSLPPLAPDCALESLRLKGSVADTFTHNSSTRMEVKVSGAVAKSSTLSTFIAILVRRSSPLFVCSRSNDCCRDAEMYDSNVLVMGKVSDLHGTVALDRGLSCGNPFGSKQSSNQRDWDGFLAPFKSRRDEMFIRISKAI